MYNFAIVDDSPLDRKRIIDFIQEHCLYHHTQFQYDEYSCAEDFLLNKVYDAIFLDIDMPGKKGTTLAREINKKMNTKIIFVSQFDEFIYATLDMQPFHFIHKSKLNTEIIHVLSLLFQSLQSSTITLNTKRGQKNIKITDIEYLQIEDKLIIAHTSLQDYDIWHSISSIYEILKTKNFFKINQSTLVNLDYISKFDEITVTMKDSTVFSLSRRLKKGFTDTYESYLLNK